MDGGPNGRRQFLAALGGAALSAFGRASAASAGGVVGTTSPKPAARVVIVKAKKVLIDGYDADRGAMRAMLEAGLCRLSGRTTAASALAMFIRPSDRVGFKINGLAGRHAATHVELVDELAVLAERVGVDPRRQIAFDRFQSDLTASGFNQQRGMGYACVGNDQAGHEEELEQMPSSASRLCLTLTKGVDSVINLPVLKQHMLAGMTGALKNNFGCIHNPNKMHLTGCDPYVAEVNALPVIRRKQKLIIMDALRPVVHGGPSFHAPMAVPAFTLLFATDPVAIDTIGLQLLETLRAKRGLPSLDKEGIPAQYLTTATQMGLGVGDRSLIEVISVEV
jgi:uncharacterized protein (DUF362 family)